MNTTNAKVLFLYDESTNECSGIMEIVMEETRYLLDLERAIFNWCCGREKAAPDSVFNAIVNGMNNDMQVIVPIKTPEILQENPEKVKAEETFSSADDLPINFRHVNSFEEDRYFIPIFTSQEELNRAEPSSSINQSLKDLFKAVYNWENCDGYIINPWGQKVVLPKQIINMILEYKPKSHINFVKGSVVDMHVSAIVNAANQSLLGGGGVDGAIHRAAGPELLKECRTLNGCNTGEAKITGAYNIDYADYIIHTVGPVYSGNPRDAELLADCYTNSLDLALENGCNSIAFPGISTGVYGYPLDEAAEVSLMSVVDWLNDHPETVMNIYFCCFRDAELSAYTKLVKRIG